ncbi:probable cytochrome P450 6d4 [Phlebotomus argentipes]|uniref:probable cytochrome P450 6d4 n=1 Tax=Phlebotomus argentipes TaxID=94469 RepID=UPI00289344B7|nr:probable cytochrome P450 6d4 [Phlebotomus argentipes]
MLLILLCVVLGTAYLFFRNTFLYWKRKGFPHLTPSIPFGNIGDTVRQKLSLGNCLHELYKQSTEPFVGIYLFFRPALLIRDANLAKSILSSDFEYFYDRGVHCDEENDPLSATMFALSGQKWKHMRSVLSPTFTSGKLKNMFPTIMETATQLQNYIDPLAKEGKIIEMFELSVRYTVDIIGSVFFGITVDTINNPENKFREIGKIAQGDNLSVALRSVGLLLVPKLLEIFRVGIMPPFVGKFVINLVKDTIEYREKNSVTRNDFMQLLLQLRNTGKVSASDETWQTKAEDGGKKMMSIEQCAAQVFLFYIAGSESSAMTICFCIHELCHQRTLLLEAQREVDDMLRRHNGKVTYDNIQELPFLDKCINETIRKYPALPILNREATKDYPIPGTDRIIEKGTPVIISLFGLHMDPKYFPEPEKFKPSRFDKGNNDFVSNAFYPFGDGPRNCIAQRMGKIVVKVGLVMLLSKYDFHCTDSDHPHELHFKTTTLNLSLMTDAHLKVTTRKSAQLAENGITAANGKIWHGH